MKWDESLHPRDNKGRFTEVAKIYNSDIGQSDRELSDIERIYNSDSAICKEKRKYLTKREYAQLSGMLSLMKRKYGDNFPDMKNGYPIQIDDKVVIVTGTFESFNIESVIDCAHFLHYFLGENDI